MWCVKIGFVFTSQPHPSRAPTSLPSHRSLPAARPSLSITYPPWPLLDVSHAYPPPHPTPPVDRSRFATSARLTAGPSNTHLAAMPPRKAKMEVPKVKSPSAASQAAAASQAKSAADSQDLAGVNSEHYSKVQDVMLVIESVPELKDIKDTVPGEVCEGGASMQPYSATVYQTKMKANESYLCGHNLFLTNPLRDASPGFHHVSATTTTTTTQSICQAACEASPSTPPR